MEVLIKIKRALNYLSRRGELIVLSFLTAITIALYNNWPAKILDENLSANLLAGAIWSLALAATVGYILRRNENARTLNARFAMYADCCLLVNQFAGLWADVIKASTVVSTHPKLGEDLLSDKFSRIVASNLDVSKSSQVSGDPTWAQVIQNKTVSIQAQIDKALDTYISVSDSRIIKPLRDFKQSPTINLFAKAKETTDIQKQLNSKYQRSLPIAQTFLNDMENYKEICTILKRQRKYFSEFGEIIEPFDLNWDGYIEQIGRTDLHPQIGSAVRPFPSSAEAAIVSVGRGPPPAQPGRTGRKRL
ncbi:hypothetical protein ACU4GR_29670 [Methylobacterium oryzae CBMB20]